MGLHSSRGKSLGFNANQLNELSTTTKSLPMPGGQEGVCHSDGGVEGGKEGGVLVLHQLEQRVVENLSPVHQVFTGQLSLSRTLSVNQATTLKGLPVAQVGGHLECEGGGESPVDGYPGKNESFRKEAADLWQV